MNGLIKSRNILKTEKNNVPQNPTMKTSKHIEDFSEGIRASESFSSETLNFHGIIFPTYFIN